MRAALPVEEGYETRPLVEPAARLVEAARPELRRVWRPTRINFLSRVSRAILLEIVRATLGAEEERRLISAKRGDLVDVLHGVFNEEGPRGRLDAETLARLDAWVPEVVRHASPAAAAEMNEEGEVGGVEATASVAAE